MTLENKINYRFNNPELLKRALTHKSFFNENSTKVSGHNECLEFLGDAVIDLSISSMLMDRHPNLTEGELSKVRASLVNETTLAEIANQFYFSNYILLGKGESASGGASKPRLLASAFEAFIGALFQDSNFDTANAFLNSVFKSRIEAVDLKLHFASDYKTRLQEVIQEKEKKTPYYSLVKEEGPDHEKIFFVEVRVDEKVLAIGSGRSKKVAEQNAAQIALEEL